MSSDVKALVRCEESRVIKSHSSLSYPCFRFITSFRSAIFARGRDATLARDKAQACRGQLHATHAYQPERGKDSGPTTGCMPAESPSVASLAGQCSAHRCHYFYNVHTSRFDSDGVSSNPTSLMPCSIKFTGHHRLLSLS